MARAHLSARWREKNAPARFNLNRAEVSNGIVRVGDWVRELPAPHHIQPCACVLCRDQPEAERVVQVQAIGARETSAFLILDDGYECPALEVERVARD